MTDLSRQLQAAAATAVALQRQSEISAALAQVLAAQLEQLNQAQPAQAPEGADDNTVVDKVFPQRGKKRTHFMEGSPDGEQEEASSPPRRAGPQGRSARSAGSV